MLQYVKDKKPALAFITETWLRERVMFNVKGAKIAQSPPSNNQGVLILALFQTVNLQPIYEPLWTVNTIVTLCHFKVNTRDHIAVYCLAHYS